MFFPIVIVVEGDDAGGAVHDLVHWLAESLRERCGDDGFGLTWYAGGESVPVVQVFNDAGGEGGDDEQG